MPFAGFDSLSYPGDAVMAWLKANTNFRFVGFYLAPAPSRPTSAWMARRSTLSAQGWALPPGLKLEDDGQLHGSPERTGEFQFTVASGPAGSRPRSRW